jgi:hypothetical protein
MLLHMNKEWFCEVTFRKILSNIHDMIPNLFCCMNKINVKLLISEESEAPQITAEFFFRRRHR